jgi:hypothetical protein
MLRAERLTPPPAPGPGPGHEPPPPGPPPLTHHEIMRLAGPFSRSGRSVDLAASDRAARVLRWQVRELPAAGAGETAPLAGAWRERLRLEAGYATDPRAGVILHRLERELQPGPDHPAGGAARSDAGLCARLQAEGPQIDALLGWVDAVPPQRQWLQAAGLPIALGHRLLPPGRNAQGAGVASSGDAPTSPVLQLVQAQARVAGLDVLLKVSRVKNVPAEIELRPAAAQASVQAGSAAGAPPLSLPEDLLAVLGLAWSRLVRVGAVWRATVQLRGEGAARSQDAEDKIARTVVHLAQVLAQPPAAFHARFASARWKVTLRRGFPLLVCTALIGASAAVPLADLGPDSVWRMLIFNAPPLLLLWMFTLRELPRIEWPPLPRPLAADAWVAQGAAGIPEPSAAHAYTDPS